MSKTVAENWLYLYSRPVYNLKLVKENCLSKNVSVKGGPSFLNLLLSLFSYLSYVRVLCGYVYRCTGAQRGQRSLVL